MNEASVFLGIDIAKAKFDACLCAPGQAPRQSSFRNDPSGFAALRQWVGSVGPLRVGLEATGAYWMGLAHALHGLGWEVYVLNPAYVKAHGQACGQRHKTDRVDAALIADFMARHECEPWQPLPAELEELRELMRLYQDIVGVGAGLAQRREGLRTAGARALLEEITGLVQAFAQRVLRRAQEQARAHPELQKPVDSLRSIKGIGVVSALTLTAELPRGRSARSVACWAGVTPRFFESGTSVRRTPKICKQGSDYVRQMLYWPAITALRCNPAMQPFKERMAQSGHNKMQTIGGAMHKLLRWAVGVINSGQTFDPSIHLAT
jgi:transposase